MPHCSTQHAESPQEPLDEAALRGLRTGASGEKEARHGTLSRVYDAEVVGTSNRFRHFKGKYGAAAVPPRSTGTWHKTPPQPPPCPRTPPAPKNRRRPKRNCEKWHIVEAIAAYTLIFCMFWQIAKVIDWGWGGSSTTDGNSLFQSEENLPVRLQRAQHALQGG